MGSTSRRSFLRAAGLGAAWTVTALAGADKPRIQGFDEGKPATTTAKTWTPTSSRKIRSGRLHPERRNREIRSSARRWSPGWFGGESSRKIVLTGTPSRLWKSTPPGA